MSFLAPLAAVLGPGAAAGAAGATAGAAGVAGLVTPIVGTGVSGAGLFAGLSTSALLQLGAVGVSGLGALQQYQFQQRVAEENARRARESAQREADRAQQEQQDQDLLARLILGQQLTEQAASGFSLTSPSFALARRREATIARTNAQRLREESDATVRNLLSGAADAQAQAGLAARASTFSLLETGLGFGSTLLAEEAAVNRRRLASLRIA